MTIIYPAEIGGSKIEGFTSTEKVVVDIAPGETIELDDLTAKQLMLVYPFLKDANEKKPITELLKDNIETKEINSSNNKKLSDMSFAEKRDLLKAHKLFVFGLNMEKVNKLIKKHNLLT